MNKETVNKWALLLLTLFISAVFLSMIRSFLLAILLAGIFAGLSYRLYGRFVRWLKGRRSLASGVTVLFLVLVFFLPLIGLLGIVAAQALKVGEAAKPWVEKQLTDPGGLARSLESLPFFDKIQPYQNQIISKAGEIVGKLSGFLIDQISTATLGTVNFLFMLFIMLLRAIKGHFKPEDHFGFEAASWYWHFVDVVWVGLFLFVYIL